MAQPCVLIVDDEEVTREILVEGIRRAGWEAVEAGDGATALQSLSATPCDVVLTDLTMPRLSGLDLLRAVKRNRPEIPVVMMTAHAAVETAIEALRCGAYDYITKPFKISALLPLLQRALERKFLFDENRYLRDELRRRYNLEAIIGQTPAMQEAFILSARAASSSATVLVQGESGTGKEVIARAIHYQSGRAHQPFVLVNCAALPQDLLEVELFGHEKGAFTDAHNARVGRFGAADGGTLFLDEVGDMTPAVQVKLLRVLQEKEFERVGSNRPVKVDVRIIAATHRDLLEAMATGAFREDLFYRLNVIPIWLPPLRERQGDILPLSRFFLERHGVRSLRGGSPVPTLSKEAERQLLEYPWPGNIRELENCVERAVVLCMDDIITPQHLMLHGTPLRCAPDYKLDGTPLRSVPDYEHGTPLHSVPDYKHGGLKMSPHSTLRDVERAHVAQVLRHADWNISRAATMLGISRKTLRRKIREHLLQGTEDVGAARLVRIA